MKADESADCAGRRGGRLPTGLFIQKKKDFGWVKIQPS
jgi:hypothetical protein